MTRCTVMAIWAVRVVRGKVLIYSPDGTDCKCVQSEGRRWICDKETAVNKSNSEKTTWQGKVLRFWEFVFNRRNTGHSIRKKNKIIRHSDYNIIYHFVSSATNSEINVLYRRLWSYNSCCCSWKLAYRYATPSGRRPATCTGLEYSEPPVSEYIKQTSCLSDDCNTKLLAEHVS